jgi:MarR family transcriptional regulator, organic hydroperoxide resistance regulator
MPNKAEPSLEAPGLVFQLARTYNLIAAQFERRVGVHPGRWRVLFLIARAGTCTQKELARSSLVHAGAITRVLQDLEQLGFVQRARDAADNRLTRVSLTGKGARFVKRMLPERNAMIEAGVRGLGAKDLKQAEAVLRRIEQNLLSA